jgi:protein-S-isoprenylcysteine O-methyltransferase Ste14
MVKQLRLPLLSGIARRRFSDFLLFGVTVAELILLLQAMPGFSLADWIYVLQHLIVLGIALTRPAPEARDYSLRTSIAVAISYGYPYAQVIYLGWVPGEPVWPAGGFVLIVLSATLSFVSLIVLGRRFGIRPALRGLVTRGPYRVVRHPIYFAYLLGDIGYNLMEWNPGTALLVIAGWTSLVYRIRAEERVLSQSPQWPAYVASVRWRLLPGLW